MSNHSLTERLLRAAGYVVAMALVMAGLFGLMVLAAGVAGPALP